MKKILRSFFKITCLVVLLSGCGFHLRGHQQAPLIPYPSLHLQTHAPYSYLTHALEDQLKSHGVILQEATDTATPTLEVSADELSTQDLAYSADGEVRRQRVNFQLNFNLTAHDGTVLIADQTLSVFRDQLLNPDQSLGDAYEQKMIEKELQQDAIQLLLFRLEASKPKG
jgi:LPS-assembly lipoprotein